MAISFPFQSPKKVLPLFLNISFLALFLFYASVPSKSAKFDIGGRITHLHKSSTNILNSDTQFSPQGFIDYLHIFYYICGAHRALGYAILILWLLVLFYLLADTSSSYFCANLEGLSTLLKLPPTIAGVTLLSLGNGAPDAFSSIVSFMGDGSGILGLNSVLGGSFFISCVVVGIICICVASDKNTIDKPSFIRDAVFLLFVLAALTAILMVGKINLWGAVGFTSLYLVYVSLVAIGHYFFRKNEERQGQDLITDLEAPLLSSTSEPHQPNVKKSNARKILQCLQLPLSLPRRLTIPDVSKERWSRPIAVTSAALAPLLLAILLKSKRQNVGSKSSLSIYISGAVLGLVLAITAAAKTSKERPPTGCLLPWLAAGFLMSITWTYIIARELVAVLVSIGTVLEISPSILGLTVLAWGNSVGDLVACLAVAVHDREGGVQVAVTGCYGGPIFNILVGLGLSFVVSSWRAYPASVGIPEDVSLHQTVGFIAAGLLWALVVLPARGMRLGRLLASGLLAIYICSFLLRFAQSLLDISN